MFQVERQQDRELESLLDSAGAVRRGRGHGKPSLPPPDVLHSVWEKKDPANVSG